MYERLFAQAGLSLERLRSFAEIVAAGGIMAAAGDDPNRQSQLSRQLKELERYFGVELIRRGRGPMKLTAAGRQLHRAIGPALGALEECRQECANEPIELVIGAGESLIQWLLVPRLERFVREHPHVVLSFENQRNDDIVEHLIDGALDFGVVSRFEPVKALESVPLGQLEYSLFVSAEVVNESGVKSGVAVLRSTPLAVLRSSDSIRQVLERVAREHKLKLDVRLRLTSYPQLAGAVQTLRLAAAIPSLATTTMDARRVRSFQLPELESAARRLTLLWSRRAAEVRPAIARYAKVLARLFRVE